MFLFGSPSLFLKIAARYARCSNTPDILPRAEDRPMEPTLRLLIVNGESEENFLKSKMKGGE